MRVSALLAVPIALVGLAVPAYAEAGLTVTWPTTTQVEVPNTTYTFTVADTVAEPQGVLYAEWQGERTEIPHTGDHTMAFAKGGTGSIKVIRCVPATEPPGDPVCTDTGDVSPELTVWKSGVAVVATPEDPIRSGDYMADLYMVFTPSITVGLTWEVRDSRSAVRASGTGSVAIDDQGHGQFGYTIPETVNGGHTLHVRAVYDYAPFGPHVAQGESSEFRIDNAAPRLVLRLSSSAIYPHYDGYYDKLTIRASPNEWVTHKMEVRNSSGRVVRGLESGEGSWERSATWNGRDSTRRVLPAGTYTVVFRATDRVGHTSSVTKRVTLSHKRLVKKTWKRTFTPAQVHPGPRSQYVGKCSTLRKPSLRGWAGSFGFYSQTKCAHPDERSVVSTVSGVYVPKAFQNRYGTYQVWLNGGGAKSGGKRHGRNAYIVMHYRNTAVKDVHRVQFNGALGSHAGRSVAAGNFVFDKTKRPYVLWRAGLSEGSRYDVKSYTVKLTYTALQ